MLHVTHGEQEKPQSAGQAAAEHNPQADAQTAAALIASVTSGSDDAFSALSARYRPLISAMVSQFADASGIVTAPELEQECVIALYRAAISYRETRNVTFGLYARICMRNALCSLLRKKPLSDSPLPDDTVLTGIMHDHSDPETACQEFELVRFVMRCLKRELHADEMKVFCLYLDGYSYERIAAATGLSRKRVDNLLYRIKNRLKRIAGEYGF